MTDDITPLDEPQPLIKHLIELRDRLLRTMLAIVCVFVPLFYFSDRKSTRLNSSHVRISYAVFCLKKKRTKGAHRQYRHPEKPHLRTITVSGHLSDEVPKGTLNAILKQAGLKE